METVATGQRRLVGLGLAHPAVPHPASQQPIDVVRRLGAMQAQDYGQSLWAVGSRLPGSTVGDVIAAIEAGQILRTWPQRGTLHMVPAADAGWMVALSSERTVKAHRTRLRQLDLDEAVLARSRQVLETALTGHRRVNRPALLQLLEDAGIKTGNQRGYTILWHAAHLGLICLGPMEGKQPTFVLLREWVRYPVDLPRAAGLSELARRYFTSHDPATVHDFAWWASLTVTEARAAATAAGMLSVGDIATRPDAAPRGALDARAAGVPMLLAGFDEFLLGYQDRSAVLAKEHADRVVPGGNGVFQPTMVAGAQVVGTWRRTVTANAVDVTLAAFDGQDAVPTFTAAAERYAEFIGLPLRSLTATSSGVGP